MRIFTFITLFLVLISSLQAKQPELSADEPIEFDQASQAMIAKGNARLEGDNFLVQADTIHFLKKENRVIATGNVRVTRDNIRLVADRAEYDFLTKKLTSTTFKMGSPPLYMEGETLDVSKKAANATNATIHANEPDGIHPNIQAKEVTYYRSEDKVEVKGATFKVGNFPIFHLPAYTFETQEAPFNPALRGGFSDNLGAFAENSILFRVNDGFKVGPFVDAYSKRGILFGPKGEYKFDNDIFSALGNFELGYIHDWGNTGFDSLNRSIDEERFFVNGTHKGHYEDWTFTGSIDWRDDSEVIKDFRPQYFEENQEADTFLDVLYSQENYTANLFSRFRPNNFEQVQERTPELTLSLLPTELLSITELPFEGIVHQGHVSAAKLREKSITADPELNSDRLNAYYQLSKPITHKDWVKFVPLVGAHVTHYSDTIDSRSSYTRLLGEVGFDANMTMSAKWDKHNELWGIDGIRHIARPTLQYRYVPEADAGRSAIPTIDRFHETTKLRPIGLENNRYIDDLEEQHLTRVGFENTFQTKDEEYGSRQLASVFVYQDVLFSRDGDEDVLENLYTEASLSPARWLDLEMASRSHAEDLTSQSVQVSATLKDGEIRDFTLGAETLDDHTEEYFMGMGYKVSEDLRLNSLLSYDAKSSDVVEAAIGVTSQVGTSWLLNYSLAYFEHSQRQGNWRFDLSVDLLTY